MDSQTNIFDSQVKDSGEVYRRVYYGGVCHELRRQVCIEQISGFESEGHASLLFAFCIIKRR